MLLVFRYWIRIWHRNTKTILFPYFLLWESCFNKPQEIPYTQSYCTIWTNSHSTLFCPFRSKVDKKLSGSQWNLKSGSSWMEFNIPRHLLGSFDDHCFNNSQIDPNMFVKTREFLHSRWDQLFVLWKQNLIIKFGYLRLRSGGGGKS